MTALPAMMTVPYLAILNFVSAQSHAAVEATQFMLMSVPALAVAGRHDASDPGRVVFVSEVHQVLREKDSLPWDPRGQVGAVTV